MSLSSMGAALMFGGGDLVIVANSFIIRFVVAWFPGVVTIVGVKFSNLIWKQSQKRHVEKTLTIST